jgi:hypothetical protein
MYQRLPVEKLTGDELFRNTNQTKFSVREFWRYGFSNLNSNVMRGVLAEFIVENALNEKDIIGVRNPWGDYDVLTEEGVKVEVKCCSYIQDWNQDKFTVIRWAGLKATPLYWSSAVAAQVSDAIPDYKSDVYVLALVDHQDPATLDLLNLNQWRFYVLSRERLREVARNGGSVSLSQLTKSNIASVGYVQLVGAVASIYPTSVTKSNI